MKHKIIIMMVLLLSFSMVNADIDNPYMTWDFKDVIGTTIPDNTINQYDGQIFGSPSYYTSSGTTFIDFTGTNSYVEAEFSYGQNLTGDFTVSLWLNTSNTLASIDYIFGESDHNNLRTQDNGVLKARIHNTLSPAYATTINDGELHHVVYGLNGSNGFLIVDDGLKVGWSVGATNSQTFIDLGRRAGSSPYWDGSIGILNVYDDVLNDVDVTTLYNGGTPLTTNNELILNPVVYYDFETLSGGNVVDSGSYSDTGEINGGVTFDIVNGVTWANFTGTTGNIVLDTNMRDNLTGAWTSTLWINTLENLTNTYIFGDMDFNFLRMQTGALRTRIGGDFSQFYPNSTELDYYNNGLNHFVVFGYDGVNSFLNVDNGAILYDSDSHASSTQPRTTIGKRDGNPSDYFDGRIAYFRLFDYALNSSQQTQIYELDGLNQTIIITPPTPPPVDNTYSSFITFENETINSFLDYGSITPLNLTSGTLTSSVSLLRDRKLTLSGSTGAYLMSGLNNLTGQNHTIGYTLITGGFSPSPSTSKRLFNNDFDVERECGFWLNGTYYCSDENGRFDILPFDDNSATTVTHVYDGDNQIEYIYTTRYSVNPLNYNPILRKTLTGINGSRILRDDGSFNIQPQIFSSGTGLDEIYVYGNTLDNESIKSITDNGTENTLFIQHLTETPAGMVFINSPNGTHTLNSTGKLFTFDFTSATGYPTPYYDVFFTNDVFNFSVRTQTLSNNFVESISKFDVPLTGEYNVRVRANNSIGESVTISPYNVSICVSVYEAILSTCINDTQTKTYNDVFSCGEVYDFPTDNGTIVSCDDGFLSDQEFNNELINIKNQWLTLGLYAFLMIFGIVMRISNERFLPITTTIFVLVGIGLVLSFPEQIFVGVIVIAIAGADLLFNMNKLRQ